MPHSRDGQVFQTWLNRRRFAALGLAAATVGPARAQASMAGDVAALSGEGYAKLDQIRRLSPKAEILVGDLVWTAAHSRMTLALAGGGTLRLGGKTSLRIDRYLAASGGDLAMGDGALVFDRAEDLPKTRISVRSVFGQIAVRGTRFFAGPSGGKPYAVFCDRGEVIVRGHGARRRLGPGDGVDFAERGAAPGPVVKWGEARIKAAFASVL